MNKEKETLPPPDKAQRNKAIDPTRSVLVRAPAGSGKTDLLTRRFLRLLAEVNDPGEIVAITFTKAAAAEMRNRILTEIENAAGPAHEYGSEGKREMAELAAQALGRSKVLEWNLLDLPAQLRITTIDAFCRELALQKPLLSGLGGGLDIADSPEDLYHKAACRTLNAIGDNDAELRAALEILLLWRDNNWQDIESQLVEMLRNRDRWMREIVLARNGDWEALRKRLERPFASADSEDGSPIHYTEDEWAILKACFTVLRRAAAELNVVFAESGKVDYTEIAQIAAAVLEQSGEGPSEGALAAADNIKHLLVDEFQDTSRKQHRLLQSLIAAWPDRDGRTCFVVGDAMQSIYLFRDADAELFGRVERLGLEIDDDLPLTFESAQLSANFRTAPELVVSLNESFNEVFRAADGSGVTFAPAEAARDKNHAAWEGSRAPRMQLHVEFVPSSTSGRRSSEDKSRVKEERVAAQEKQTAEIVDLIRGHWDRIKTAIESNGKVAANDRQKYRVAVLGRTKKALAGITAGLHMAAVPYRAVELEELKDRPEVMDALALGRALMNTEDRVAWLGVLRAPWCGLALDDMHRLLSGDDDELIRGPVPDLMQDRANLLNSDGCVRVTRLLHALESAPSLRRSHPARQLGTWLEQVWLRVGGSECVSAAERENLDLLWRTLDALPEGEQDFVGPALDAALGKLCAQPDPGADAECGVQLMTIHKSKGLEFEVVIVPELQAGSRRGEFKMLSWLERGLLDPDESEEPTELLIAPFQAKGAERGSAKKWVDDVYRERERQEMRRVLYVAATRAREELHMFARPEFKESATGRELAEPRESLLKTAWPAFKEEIKRQFEAWDAEQTVELTEIAAQAAEIVEFPNHSLAKNENSKTGPRRLPSNWRAPEGHNANLAPTIPIAGLGRLYERHEGGLESRALGRAVHQLLEHSALLRAARNWDEVRVALEELEPRLAAEIRSAGIERSEAARIAQRAIAIADEATRDEAGRWILSPREDAESEVRWAGIAEGTVRTVQADRVFRAGEEPLSERGDVWWIVDYKTAHQDGVSPDDLRPIFASQLEAYARVLRNLRGADVKVCAGLYYPRIKKLDWWAL